jgi:hypothetical protein
MLDLKENTVKQWLNKLPDDIKENISEDIPSDLDGMQSFCEKLENSTQAEWLEVIKNNFSMLTSMGRVRRLRLLSHISGQVYPYNVKVFHQIVNNEEEIDDESGGSQTIKELFLEDIKALNEAIAARVASHSLDNSALEAIRTTSYEVTPSMEIK